MRDSLTPEQPPSGPLYASESHEPPALGSERGPGVAPGPQTGAQSLDGHELRRALAADAVGPALNKHGAWLPDHVRQAVADAVLAAVDTAPAEAESADGDVGGCALPGFMACNCNHIDGCQHPAAPAERVAFTDMVEVATDEEMNGPDPDEAIKYPHPDGDITVLGPEIFASSDGQVICWKGENYVPQGLPVPDDRRERFAQYAAAIDKVTGGTCPADILDAVIAVADRERAALMRAHVALATQAGKDQAALARVRGVVADMHGTTGARHWARWLDSVLDATPDPQEQP